MQTAFSDYDNIYRSGRAVSLLRKKAIDLPLKATVPTLFDKLLDTAWKELSFEELDQTYRRIYQHVSDNQIKSLIVKNYLESFANQAAKSKWFKAIIFASTSPSRKHSRARGNSTKEIIAEIKFTSPGITAREICSRLDRLSIPILQSWQLHGNRTWSHAYLNPKLRGRVKTYISKIDPQCRY